MLETIVRMSGRKKSSMQILLFAALLAASIQVSPLWAQQRLAASASASDPSPAKTPSIRTPNRFPKRAHAYYSLYWGIDSLSVKAVESGELIRFTWRVIDADKAKPLNDLKIQPSLIDPAAGVQLVVPSLPFMGEARQKSDPEGGKLYWMAFSNPTRNVKRGDHVNIVIGQFHADNLLVQ